MGSASWIQEYTELDPQRKSARLERLGRDKNLALILLAFAFVALVWACALNFRIDHDSIWYLDPVAMFVMSVSAGICAALGAVMWLRMEIHIRVFELLSELRR